MKAVATVLKLAFLKRAGRAVVFFPFLSFTKCPVSPCFFDRIETIFEINSAKRVFLFDDIVLCYLADKLEQEFTVHLVRALQRTI